MGLEGESRVVRRTAAWDIPEQSMPAEYLEMRIKGPLRGTSSPTLPGFPMMLHERGGSGSAPELAFRFTDADGRERTVPERREPPAGPCIVSYAALVNPPQPTGGGADWERGYLATIALCRMLVKERFEGALDLDSIGLDPHGGVVWVSPLEGHRGVPVTASYVSELSRSSDRAAELVGQLGTLFYRFMTGRQPSTSGIEAASELNVQAPPWVDTICNAALSEPRCASVAEFLDLLHQHLTDEQREQVSPRLAEWALRSRRLSQPTEDAVAVQLGAALSHLGVAAARKARRRRMWLPISVAAVATLLGLAAVLRNMHVI